MISVPIHNTNGEEVGNYEFDPADLAPGINKQLLHDVVVMYEANKRVGTVQTKSRGMVRGSTAKMYRQKGTGRARAGSRRSPIRRGGGHAFGKKPRDWGYRLPKKAVRLAMRMALLSKFQDHQAVVIDSLAFDAPKTSKMAGVLKAVGCEGLSCLLSTAEHDPVIWKSARNIQGVQVLPCHDLNAYDLLHQRQLVVTRDAIDRLLHRNGSE